MKKDRNKDSTVAVPQPQKAQVISAQQLEFKGPIPPPEIFRQYREVIPDAPERILKVFEEDSQHTREMQKAALTAETQRDARAQWMAFIIILAALGVTGVAVVYGNAVSGILTGIGTLVLALRVLFVKKNSEPTGKKEESR